jgi:thiamine monophosphate synthase
MFERVRRLADEHGVHFGVQVRTGFEHDADALVTLCRSVGARLWFNRDLARALAYGAGFHGSSTQIAAARNAGVRGGLSVPVHSLQELEDAAGADTVLISPVFDVPGKGMPLGLKGLARLAAAASCEVIALGGITRANADQVRNVHGIAAIRATWQGNLG